MILRDIFEILLQQVIFGSLMFVLIFGTQMLLKKTSLYRFFSFFWVSYFIALMIPVKLILKNIMATKSPAITFIELTVPKGNIEMIPSANKGWHFFSQQTLSFVCILNKNHLTRRLEMMVNISKHKRRTLFYPLVILVLILSGSVFAVDIKNSIQAEEYVTIKARIKKSGVIISQPAIIVKVGQEASIRSHNGENGLALTVKPEYSNGGVEAKGTFCYSEVSESEFMVDSKELIPCEKEASFHFKTKFNKPVSMNINVEGNDHINIDFTVDEGAKTEKVLSGFEDAGERGVNLETKTTN